MSRKVGRQISLPLSKAIEIAWKSIRVRLSRSLLVTSSIVLALAFLVSIQASESVTNGMRAWIAQQPASPRFEALRGERHALEEAVAPLRDALRAAAADAPADAGTFDVRVALGRSWEQLQADAGAPPASTESLSALLAARPEQVDLARRYFDAATKLKAVRTELSAPDVLAADMAGRGIPTKPDEIAADRTQTRWLLGLALLVAFVGILNAMLMSVTERFREIGTMKCLGALDSFIVKLFLIESLFQGVAGTAVGILLGLAVSFATAWLTYGSYAFISLPWGEVGLAVLLSLAVGMFMSVGGALLPAIQAARMEPIAAMRVEA